MTRACVQMLVCLFVCLLACCGMAMKKKVTVVMLNDKKNTRIFISRMIPLPPFFESLSPARPAHSLSGIIVYPSCFRSSTVNPISKK